ncbi:LPS biosynthesis protein [Salinivibrio proteolyticus]|uniref:LPS-assembly lipoprotein LptE n=1 Tax=Salinivibrio proteolyticus TaxID=334715 RepID=UPI0009C8A25A|nr:LPS assembly lipoprotein LptE [Salinivibrio proteolyticus]OOF24890.1 LPS biosynthesis protein [Salinivibrio proteolyticus]
MTLFKPVFRFLLVAVVALTTASCGFALRDSYNLPDEVTQVSLTSVDPYGELTRQLRNQLNQHKVELVAPANTVTNIHLLGESNSEQTLSLYQNSRVAEKEFRYVARYRVTVPQKGSYTFSTTLSRNFLDNPLTALAKSVEQDKLVAEMRTEATRQIMRQLSQLKGDIAEFERRQAEQAAMEQLEQGESPTKPEIIIETRQTETDTAQ